MCIFRVDNRRLLDDRMSSNVRHSSTSSCTYDLAGSHGLKGYLQELSQGIHLILLTPEPNGVSEGVYGIGRVLRHRRRRRRRRRRDAVSVWTP